MRQIANRGSVAECRQLGVRVLGHGVVVSVKNVRDRGSNHCSGKLSHHIAGHAAPFKLTGHRQANRHGRVEVSSADVTYARHRGENGKAPASRDHDQPRVVPFRLLEQHIGDNSRSQKKENCRTDEFCQIDVHRILREERRC